MARRSDHTREELIEMALSTTERFLGNRPLGDISARQIAKEIGYTVGTLYTLFDNLADLQLQVNSRSLDALRQTCLTAGADEVDPTTRIKAYARAYVGFSRQNPHRWRAVFTRILPEEVPLPQWFDSRVGAMFEMLERPLRAIAPKKSDADIQDATRILWGSVHGITSLSLDDHLFNSQTDEMAMTDALIGNFLASWIVS